ncbi:YEATS-associated helix-containing protein [Oceanobacter mangrovi]|uniref:YEATS-associated helix-containing protein n=1 Tax=Oceanobacter mangrovi TaxID=2862510 RepID=UPI001C8DF4D2|nr:YEATS-associated helix-containing protein [Oceanobacter mangrovi]
MANHIFILATVMLLAGIFGGLVNYYLYGDKDPDAASLPRFLVVGVGASFLVPVVLDMVNSELVLESQGDPSRLLIFTGFCLISALISRFFIDNLSDRILTEAKVAKQRSDEVHHNLITMQKEILPLVDTETEQDGLVEDAEEYDLQQDLDVTSTEILKVLSNGRFIFRSLAGVCREANQEESTALKTLHVLVTRSLAGKVSSKSGVRWHITEKGRRVLEANL